MVAFRKFCFQEMPDCKSNDQNEMYTSQNIRWYILYLAMKAVNSEKNLLSTFVVKGS